jgi:hypothetical protein
MLQKQIQVFRQDSGANNSLYTLQLDSSMIPKQKKIRFSFFLPKR